MLPCGFRHAACASFILLLALAPAGLCRAQPKEELVELTFSEDVDIRVIVDYVSTRLNKRFLYDETLQGTVTIRSPGRVPLASLYSLLESILQMKGFAMIPAGDWIKIVKSADIQKQATKILTPQETAKLPKGDQVATQVIQLEHASVEDAVQLVTPFLTTPGGSAQAVQGTDFIIITDYGSNLKRIVNLVQLMDQEKPAVLTKTIPLKHIFAKATAEKLDRILSAAAGTPAQKPEPGGTVELTRALVEPDARTNSILVVGYASQVKPVEQIIAGLDVQTTQGPGRTQFYHLDNVKCDEAVKTLTSILEATAAKKGKEGEGGAVKAIADVNTNSIIVVAPPEEQVEIAAIVKGLDFARPQVLIDAMVVEASKDVATDLGVEVYTFPNSRHGVKTFGYTSMGPGRTGTPQSVTQLPGGQRVFNPLGGLTAGFFKSSQLPLVVNALTTKANGRILAKPNLTVNDNQKANFKSIREEPYTSTNAINTSTSTTSYGGKEEAGITLEVTPHISDANYLSLDVTLEISRFSGPPANENVPPPKDTDRVETQVTIDNDSTLVIGGLNMRRKTENISKVPLLGDIPVLGVLFRSTGVGDQDIVLYVFITPQIVRGRDFARADKLTDKPLKHGQKKQDALDQGDGWWGWTRYFKDWFD
ncbi:MAG: type II secretion system secretin GspD [Planctomycetes bacterium]|nr:type II secretion system secretin GspD [Planctomycetota bacterium]